MVRFYVGVDELETFWRGVLVSVRILTAKCAKDAKEKSLSFCLHTVQARVSRAFVFAAKNLSPILRDPHRHCIRSAVHVSLSLRMTWRVLRIRF